MTDLFLEILNLSISAGWLVLAVLVLRLVSKKAPKWVNVLLWAIVAVRLVLPVTLESEVSLIPSSQTVSPEIMMTAKPTVDTGVPVINDVVNPVISQSFAPQPLASANPLQILLPVAANLWILGIILMLLYTLFTYLRLRFKARTAVRVRDNIYQTEKIASPFVLGIIKPRIYLPFTMGQQDMDYVIAHENAHIRRKDHWWKPLGFLILAVYWFNPLLWVAYILLCRDIELACDEKVVKKLETEQRADYSQALLNSSVNRKMIAACPLAFGEVGVKARVKSVLNYKKSAFWIILVSIVLCIVVAVCFLTDPLQHQYMLGIKVTTDPLDGDALHVNWSFYELNTTDWFHLPRGTSVRILEANENSALIELEEETGEQTIQISVESGKPQETTFTVLESNYKRTYLFFVERIQGEIHQGKVTHWFGDSYNLFEGYHEAEMTTLPGKTGVTIQIDNENDALVVVDHGETKTVALPVSLPWGTSSAYFCDISGDKVPELCMNVGRGSGIVDNIIIVYDHAEGMVYTMENRFEHNYYLSVENEELIVTQYDEDLELAQVKGPLKLMKVLENREAALAIHPAQYLHDPQFASGEERLPVGDYVLGELISGKPDGAADYDANRVKRFGVREESIVLDKVDGQSEYKQQWGWINTSQAGKRLMFLKDSEFYQQAVKKGYLYQNVDRAYHLFKDGDKLYMGFQYVDYVDKQYKLNVYEFLPAPPEPVTLAQTHHLYIMTQHQQTENGTVQIRDMQKTESIALHTFNSLNVHISEITADSVKLVFDKNVNCDGKSVDHILLKPGNRVTVTHPETEYRLYTFYLEEKSRVSTPGEAMVWLQLGYDTTEQAQITIPQLPGVFFELDSSWGGNGFFVTDGSRTRAVLDDRSVFGYVRNAYFCDLTGDGIPELCTTFSRGSGIVDELLVVYDYTGENLYTMQDRMVTDYRLRESDGILMVDQLDNSDSKQLASGQLRMVKSSQDGEWMLALLVE